ncbi:hypothetical protein Daus18300_001043 [Diaporthe australafricana]|uniref:hydroxyacid-oxoacid transhydrogenase n=1 Tax=Diaporthe australafricana TaxID=127596 RepID=A0ABR3XYU8_9PEZI
MTAAVRVIPRASTRAVNLLRAVQFTHPPSCPCHSNPGHHHNHRNSLQSAVRRYATPQDSSQLKEYAFEMAASSIRFGPGVTREVGMDFKNMGSKRVCVVTDETVDKLTAMQQVREALTHEGVNFRVFNKVRVEPKDSSIREAIDWAKPFNPDAFLAVGGGSVIDTAKLMNLYSCYPDADFLDFVNAPLGNGRPIDKPLKPLVAVPTTAGTGSETTGTAIFDLVAKRAKTGIAHRNLKPTLGICDPLNTRTMPAAVKASSGLDVLCHSLESWTAIPYHERTPRPQNPILRPAYQGANPISDIFSLKALHDCVKYLPRSVRDPDDMEAQSQMLLAATLAGVGFGNAGELRSPPRFLARPLLLWPLPPAAGGASFDSLVHIRNDSRLVRGAAHLALGEHNRQHTNPRAPLDLVHAHSTLLSPSMGRQYAGSLGNAGLSLAALSQSPASRMAGSRFGASPQAKSRVPPYLRGMLDGSMKETDTVICAGMSYPISGQNPGYQHAGYEVETPIIPHGVSVAVTSPAVFKFTAASNPERHLQAAQAFGVDISNVKRESAGEVLAEALRKFLDSLGDQPTGLKQLGFGSEHIDDLVEGTIPQARVLMLAPNLAGELQTEREQLRGLFEESL